MHAKCPLDESMYVEVFAFLDLGSLLEVLATSKRFRFITDRAYFSELFGRHLVSETPLFSGCSSYADFRKLRSDMVQLLCLLRAASEERGWEAADEKEAEEHWFPLEQMCQTIEAQFASDPRVVDRVLFALSRVLCMSPGEDRPTNLLAAVRRGGLQQFFLGPDSVQAPRARQTQQEPTRWTRPHCVECVATRLAAYVRRLTAPKEWKALQTSPAARATPGEYLASAGRHVVEPGLEFLATLQARGYDRGLVEGALHRCAVHVWSRLCPELLVDHPAPAASFEALPAEVLRACRLDISRRSRFQVLPLLTSFLFKQERSTRGQGQGQGDTMEGGDTGLGLHGAPSERYYDVNCSFLDRVVEQGCGIPLTLCALLCMAAARVGLGGVHMLNLPGHVKCGLLVRADVDRATGEPNEHPIFGFIEQLVASSGNRALEGSRCLLAIDCFAGGLVDLVGATPGAVSVATMPPASAISMWTRATNNITNVASMYTSGTPEGGFPKVAPLQLARTRLQAQALVYLLNNPAISYIGEEDEDDLGREIHLAIQAAHLGLVWPVHKLCLKRYPTPLVGEEADPAHVSLQQLVRRVCRDEVAAVENSPARRILSAFRECLESARAAERQAGWC